MIRSPRLDDEHVPLGALVLMTVLLWAALIFTDLCYGQGWCRIRTDEYGPPGPLEGSMMFRLGGWADYDRERGR